MNTIRMMTLWLMSLLIAGAPALPAGVDSSAQDVVRRLFAAFNRHDLEALVLLYSSDAVLRSTEFCEPRRGPEDVRRTYSELFRQFPDIIDEASTPVVSGDRVAVQFVSRSQGFEPTKQIRLATFFTIRNGLIVLDETYLHAQGRPCS